MVNVGVSPTDCLLMNEQVPPPTQLFIYEGTYLSQTAMLIDTTILSLAELS